MSIPINLNDDLFEWQDDAEVTSCFICDRPYNIFLIEDIIVGNVAKLFVVIVHHNL